MTSFESLKPVFTHAWLARVSSMFRDGPDAANVLSLPEIAHPLMPCAGETRHCDGHDLSCGLSATGECSSLCRCSCTDFGQAAKKWFTLDQDAIYLNHGSYGAAYAVALVAQSIWRERLESHPCRFVHTNLLESLTVALRCLATFLNAPPAGHTTNSVTSSLADPLGLAFVPNATTAVNIVVKSIKWKPGDILLLFDIA